MVDNTRDGVFFVGFDRTAVEAFGLKAVVTSGGDGLLETRGRFPTFKETDVAPSFFFIEAVESMTGDDAGFAAGAAVEGDFKGVLFPGLGFFEGDEVFVEVGAEVALVVLFGELGDGCLQFPLIPKELVDEVVLSEVVTRGLICFRH